MKLTLLLAVAGVAGLILSGCAQKPTTVTPSTSATVATNTTPRTTSSSPTNATSPVPSAPQQVFKGTIAYKTAGNDADQSFSVTSGTKSLEVTVYVNATGPWTLSAPGGQGKPFVEFKDKNGASTKVEFTGGTGTSAGSVAGPLTQSLANPVDGTWTVGVRGTGNNVQADIRVVAKFT